MGSTGGRFARRTISERKKSNSDVLVARRGGWSGETVIAQCLVICGQCPPWTPIPIPGTPCPSPLPSTVCTGRPIYSYWSAILWYVRYPLSTVTSVRFFPLHTTHSIRFLLLKQHFSKILPFDQDLWVFFSKHTHFYLLLSSDCCHLVLSLKDNVLLKWN